MTSWNKEVKWLCDSMSFLADRSRNGPASASTQSKHDFQNNQQFFNQQEPNTSTERMMIKIIRPMLILREVTDINGQIPNLQTGFFNDANTIHSHAQQLPEHSCVEIAAELESENGSHAVCTCWQYKTHSYTVNYAHQIKLCDKLGLMKPDAVSWL